MYNTILLAQYTHKITNSTCCQHAKKHESMKMMCDSNIYHSQLDLLGPVALLHTRCDNHINDNID